ncbi:MAG: hypothetical protein AB8G96_13810 [Phycisphaerales bacterium]
MSQTATGVPALPAATMNIVKPTAPVVARIASSELCLRGKSASFVRHVTIDVSGTPLEGSFRAGQSFGVVPPGVDAQGKPNKVRLYSLASPTWGEDGQGRVIATTPKRLIDERRPQRTGDDERDHRLFVGLASNYLCDLAEGDEVMVSGPNGRSFLLPEDPSAHDYVFVATGTGIAPFRGMLMELLQGPNGPTSSRVDVLMGTAYTTDLLYDDLFATAHREHANVHYHTAISRELRPDGRRGLYVDGLMAESMDETFRETLANPRTLIYMCGLAGMQVGVFRVLAAAGLADAYMEFRDASLRDRDPSTWTPEEIRRGIRPTKRCMLEVY